MSRLNREDETVIHMRTDDLPIELRQSRFPSYHAASKFDTSLLNSPNTWHQIIVHHKQKYDKKEILNAFYEIVGDDDFYPVAYRNYDLRDKFFIRNCNAAIHKLFDKSLTLNMPMGDNIQLTLKFNVADYKYGQIYPAKKIEKTVEKQFENLETIEGVSNVLNLDKFNYHSELADIEVNLGNKAAFDLLCKMIVQNHEILNEINGLKLSNNRISSLASMEIFSEVSLRLLDLRKNNIRLISQFKNLKNMKINDLYVLGNPLTLKLGYQEQIKTILPYLVKLDESHSAIKTTKTIMIDCEDVEINCDGELITYNIGEIFKKYSTSDKWHQVIIVHNGNYSKKQILKSLFDHCELYPCYYKVGETEDNFLVRKSFEEMEYLMENHMKLKISDIEYMTVKFRMNVANFKKGQAEPIESIMSAIVERFNLMDRLLDLENFAESKHLNNIEISLASTRILMNVLKQSGQRYLTNVVELRLGNNNIVSGKGMQSLNRMKHLKVLDLANNEIKSINELEGIPKLSIKELRLDGNPLCKKYKFANEYIKDIKKMFPELTTLDGVVLPTDNSIITYKNYLCSLEAYDFVDQFVKTYFSVYDSPNRTKLVEMYNNNAIFSMSFYYDMKKVNSHNLQKINKYLTRSKNIKKMTNFNRAYTSMHIGKEDIGVMFKYLPKTEHDLHSFTVDVTKFNSKSANVTITGVFKEPATDIMENDMSFAFSRTFILYAANKNLGFTKNTTEYKIKNEIYYISDPTSSQVRNSFKYSLTDDNGCIDAVTSEDKECFITMFQQMTGLKTIWCTRCFEETNWNYKKALQYFIEMIAKNSIPENAFIEGQSITLK